MPWLNGWLLNGWRFFWTFICTNPEVALGSLCGPCPAFWQQMHHGMKVQNWLSLMCFGVWSDVFWHPIHPLTCSEWDVQCVCNLVEWQLAFSEWSLGTACSWWCDVSLLSWLIGQSISSHNCGKQANLSTQLITSISQNEFLMLSITCSYPQSLHTTPTPINFEAEMKLWQFFPTLVHHYEMFTCYCWKTL